MSKYIEEMCSMCSSSAIKDKLPIKFIKLFEYASTFGDLVGRGYCSLECAEKSGKGIIFELKEVEEKRND